MSQYPSSTNAAFPDEAAGSVGQGDYVVQAGECLESIAVVHGFFWQTLWDLPENADLKRVREDPMVLRAGDRITIPELRLKHEQRATEARHRFRRKSVPAKMRIRFLDDDVPLSGVSYTVKIDGRVQQGRTDADGFIEFLIPPDAKQGTVELKDGEETRLYTLQLGQLDPHDSVAGVQHRLSNLGFYTGPIDGKKSGELQQAISDFQMAHALEVDGMLNDSTCEAIRDAHGS